MHSQVGIYLESYIPNLYGTLDEFYELEVECTLDLYLPNSFAFVFNSIECEWSVERFLVVAFALVFVAKQALRHCW